MHEMGLHDEIEDGFHSAGEENGRLLKLSEGDELGCTNSFYL